MLRLYEKTQKVSFTTLSKAWHCKSLKILKKGHHAEKEVDKKDFSTENLGKKERKNYIKFFLTPPPFCSTEKHFKFSFDLKFHLVEKVGNPAYVQKEM